MCTALPQWFQGTGPATAEQIAAQYVAFALDVVRSTGRPELDSAPVRRSRAGAPNRSGD